ncbi:hypothetical protein R6Q59_011911 [Mikania micrantha]
MGNCQAVDAGALVLVIQHPDGKIERMYRSLTATQVMNINPGHYVSIIIPLPSTDAHQQPLRFTRVKILRPTDTLVLGRSYRLLTTHEVMKVLRAKKHANINNHKLQLQLQLQLPLQETSNAHHQTSPVEGHERMFRQRSGSSSSISRSKSWRPSLKSISEATS